MPPTTAGGCCAASPRTAPRSRDRHGVGNFGAKWETGLDSKQAGYGPLPGNALQTPFSPRLHGGLPHFLDRFSRAQDGITRSGHRQRLIALTRIVPQRWQDIGRDPLHNCELFLVWRFHQELAHAGLAVPTNDVGKGVG